MSGWWEWIWWDDPITASLGRFELEDLNGWLPMNEAPKDGSFVDVWVEFTNWGEHPLWVKPSCGYVLNNIRWHYGAWTHHLSGFRPQLFQDGNYPYSERRAVYYRRPPLPPGAPRRTV